MSSILTQADVAKLLAEPSPLVRTELAGKMAAQIENPSLTEAELSMAQDIVRLLAHDVETSVRQALAENLRSAHRLSHDVALRLANDIEKVALPILEHSSVLTDDDLVRIVQQGVAAKQTIIAGREGLAAPVSRILADVGDVEAVARLMENTTAHIPEESLNKVVDRFGTQEAVTEKMIRRQTLPPTVTERLATLVADTMRDYLVSHHQLSPALASDIVMQSRERAVVGLTEKSTTEELEKLILQMHQHGRLTPSVIVRALCMGDVAFFEIALAVITQIPLVNARILIHDAGQLGLKSLCERAKMPANLFPVARTAIDIVHETDLDGGVSDWTRYRARVIERVLTKYEDMAAEDADYLLDKLGDFIRPAA